MGTNINGKHSNQTQQCIFRKQLQYYQWRANKQVNRCIPRVQLAINPQIIHQHQLNNIIQSQLKNNQYVDLSNISSAIHQKQNNSQPLILSFQKYVAKLNIFERQLNLAQIIWTLKVLLQGYETIYQKMGKICIGLDLIFITQQGQLRAWINSNHISNQFAQSSISQDQPNNASHILFKSEFSIINRIIQLCRQLAEDNQEYNSFAQQLMNYLQQNILNHYSFGEVRKYINGYVFKNKISLPVNLIGKLKVVKANQRKSKYISLKSSVVDHHNYNYVQYTSSQSSAGDLVQYAQSSLKSCKGGILSNNISKISMKGSYQNENDLIQKQQKSESVYQDQIQGNFVYPNFQRALKRNKDSTCMNSQFIQSKESNNHDNFKKYKDENTFKQFPKIRILNQNINSKTFNDQQIKTRKNIRCHNRSPSFDPKYVSQFIIPKKQMEEQSNNQSNEMNQSRNNNNQTQQQQSLYYYEIGQSHCPFDFLQHNKKNQKVEYRNTPSLLMNKDLSVCESVGSFQSKRKSTNSQYDGSLLNMARSAEMILIPSSKQIRYDVKNYTTQSQRKRQ